jgi:GGDEF domain-containing protein
VQVRKRLQHRVDFTNAVSASRFRLSLSVGIAEVPAVRQPPLEELLRLADALMYEQKRNKQAHASVKTSLEHPTLA